MSRHVNLSRARPRLGKTLRGAREVAGLSLRRVAKLADLSPSALSHTENGERAVGEDALSRLAHVLRLDEYMVLAAAGIVPSYLVDKLTADPAWLTALHLALMGGWTGEDLRRTVLEAGPKVRR